MHIKWGTSNVGYGASYVVFDKPNTTPAENDNRANAKSIDSSGGVVAYKDVMYANNATIEGSDPTFPGKTIGQGKRSVWYRYHSFGDGTISTNTKGSGYDTILAVWQDLNGQLKLVKWNDNGSGKQSSLSLTTKGDVNYYIEVASKTDYAGTLTYNFAFKPSAPRNDRRSSSTVIKRAWESPADKLFHGGRCHARDCFEG